MPPYHALFKVGERVRIASMEQLRDFQAAWRWHHPLTVEQLDFASMESVVGSVGYYHGGDVLYNLRDVPGTWHECCLQPAQEQGSPHSV